MRRWRGLPAGIYRNAGARHDDAARVSGLGVVARARGAGRPVEAARPLAAAGVVEQCGRADRPAFPRAERHVRPWRVRRGPLGACG
jgi:hypothetical protein